jgi:formate dehydrogenase subunit gamma
MNRIRKILIERLLVCAVIGIVMLAAADNLVAPASAQQNQPNATNPQTSAPSEQELLKQMRRIEGRGTLPNVQSRVIEQPAGRLWSRVDAVFLPLIGALAIIGMLCLLVALYLWRGSMRFGKRAGLTMLRFNVFERLVHWVTTICFLILAISGLNITFGAKVILPLIGADAFAVWSLALKYLHNYLSLPFTIGVGLIFVLWVRSNLPSWVDVEWIKRGGGMFGGETPPTGRFNAGEKMIFWTTFFGGGTVILTGYALIFPFYGTGIVAMQLAHLAHAAVGLLFIAAILVHTYMATLGTEGALEGMMSGQVDVNWAKHHHSLWYKERMGEADNETTRAPAAPAVSAPS